MKTEAPNMRSLSMHVASCQIHSCWSRWPKSDICQKRVRGTFHVPVILQSARKPGCFCQMCQAFTTMCAQMHCPSATTDIMTKLLWVGCATFGQLVERMPRSVLHLQQATTQWKSSQHEIHNWKNNQRPTVEVCEQYSPSSSQKVPFTLPSKFRNPNSGTRLSCYLPWWSTCGAVRHAQIKVNILFRGNTRISKKSLWRNLSSHVTPYLAKEQCKDKLFQDSLVLPLEQDRKCPPWMSTLLWLTWNNIFPLYSFAALSTITEQWRWVSYPWCSHTMHQVAYLQ